MRKAQIQTQAFVYILGIIIIGLVLLYGYSAIKDIKERSDDVALLTFKTQLQNEVKTISSDYGTATKMDIAMPAEFRKVCFIDSGKLTRKNADDVPNTAEYAIIKDSVQTGQDKNVFLVPDGTEAYDIGKIQVRVPRAGGTFSSFLCVDKVGKRLIFRLEGLGNAAKISEW